MTATRISPLLAGLVLTALSVSGSSSRVEVPPCDDRR